MSRQTHQIASYYHLEMGCPRPEDMEVIGNIYENPELVKNV